MYYYYGNQRPKTRPPKKKYRKTSKLFLLLVIGLIGFGAYNVASQNNDSLSLGDITKKVTPKKQPPKPTLDKELQTKLAAWAQANPGDYSITVREQNGKLRYASFQGDTKFVTASTFKVFVAYAILNKIEQGGLTMQSSTYKGNSVEYCMKRMIVQSDNDCAYQLERLYGFSALDAFLQPNYPSTTLDNYTASGQLTSAEKTSTGNDEAKIMEQLHKGTLLNAANTTYLIDLMKSQVWRERIPAGVPTEIVVADKPGWLPGIETDMAIVYGSKSTYVITVLSSDAKSSNLADLSTLVYEYLNPATSTSTSSQT